MNKNGEDILFIDLKEYVVKDNRVGALGFNMYFPLYHQLFILSNSHETRLSSYSFLFVLFILVFTSQCVFELVAFVSLQHWLLRFF